jgi:hypothetical protein
MPFVTHLLNRSFSKYHENEESFKFVLQICPLESNPVDSRRNSFMVVIRNLILNQIVKDESIHQVFENSNDGVSLIEKHGK